VSGMIVFGTRPEAIKLAPMIAALRTQLGRNAIKVVCSGQHRSLLAQTMHALDFTADVNFDLMVHHQTPAEVLRRIVSALDRFLRDHKVDWLLVQGDTATALAGAVAGYLCGVPTVHLEAGLRTHDLEAPWPEEGFRQLISRLASLHLAPTQNAHANLLAENVPEDRIVVVGNTGYDIQKHTSETMQSMASDAPYFLVTLHRRENIGAPLTEVCRRLEVLLDRYPDHHILWPRHPNPEVIEIIEDCFGSEPKRLKLVDSMDYPVFLQAMAGASVVITDSGGVQEEAASFGVPIAVVRDKTERQEIVDLGLAGIAGSDGRDLGILVDRFMKQPIDQAAIRAWREMQGDGDAAQRATDAILQRFPLPVS
jgi:UDP-N-acetylglucosamine 2-epimerase (non-hydrolysing)